MGLEKDCNYTEVPDTCEAIANCDFNVDGAVDLTDYAAFRDASAGPEQAPSPSEAECTNACLAAFDADGDSDIDLKDFATLSRLFCAARGRCAAPATLETLCWSTDSCAVHAWP